MKTGTYKLDKLHNHSFAQPESTGGLYSLEFGHNIK